MIDDRALPTETTLGEVSASSASPAVTNPAEQLIKLKEAMQQDQTAAEKLKKQMVDRKSAIDNLEKALAATNQLSDSYSQTVQALSVDRLEIQDFLANEVPRLEKLEVVAKNRSAIDEIIRNVDAAIDAKDKEQRALEQEYKDERTALQDAIDDLAAKKLKLDSLQRMPRMLQDRFGSLRKLSQRIKSDGTNKPLVKYVLALELKARWDESMPLLISQEQLVTSFYATAEEVRAAEATSTAHDEHTKRALTKFESAREGLGSSKVARLDEIIKQVASLPPATTVPVTSATPAMRIPANT